MADEAQPDQGQGDTGSGGLFDSYLQAVPEDARDYVRGYLEDAGRNVNSRFEEAAALQKQYEPFAQIDGISQYQPDELGQLLAWHQSVASSEDAYRQFIAAQAQELGLTEQQVEETPELTPESVQALIEEAVASRVAPAEERLQTFETQQWVENERTMIRDRMTELETEAGVQLTDEQRDRVLRLAESMVDGDNVALVNGIDWVKPGFDEYLRIRGEGAQGLVDDKVAQPSPAVAAGGTAVHELPKSWEDARERVRERLRQSRAT